MSMTWDFGHRCHFSVEKYYVMSFHGVTPWYKPNLNTLRPGENGRLFEDDIFKCIFLTEMLEFRLRFHWSFFPRGPINNNNSALVQIMAWRRPGDKPSHYLNHRWLDYLRIYASLGLSGLRFLQCIPLPIMNPLIKHPFEEIFCNDKYINIRTDIHTKWVDVQDILTKLQVHYLQSLFNKVDRRWVIE